MEQAEELKKLGEESGSRAPQRMHALIENGRVRR
jgi:hypothetical protein